MWKHNVLIKLVQALCMVCMPWAVWAAGAAVAEPTVIEVVHDGDPEGFAAQVVKEWASLLEERSAGGVVLQYEQEEQEEQDGQSEDAKKDVATALEKMAEGKNVIALVALPTRELNMPNNTMLSTLPGTGVDPLFVAYSQALRQQGLRVVMGNYHGGTPLFLAKKPLYQLSDMAGLRIATTANLVQQQLLEAQGATPVEMDPAAVATALTYGTVDGAEGSLFTLYENGWQESAKYLSDMGGEPIITVWLGSEDFLERLPREIQEMIAETAHEAGLYSQELAKTYTEEVKQALQDEGVQLIGFKTIRAVPLEEVGGGLNPDLYRVPTATPMTP